MARVEIYQPKTDNFAQNLAFKKVKQLITVVQLEARRHATRYTGNSVPEPTGRFALTIRSNVGRKGRWSVVGTVGSSDRLAMVLHIGAKPHVIRPVNAGGLRFFWKQKGRFVCIKGPVYHPGMQGKFYLTNPLRIEGPRLGFRVITSVEVERLLR